MEGQRVGVVRLPMRGPGDVAGLLNAIDRGEVVATDIVAIIGKTEGNGGVNDFTREYATVAISSALSPLLNLPPEQVVEQIAFVMSGGTEGVLSPHITVFTRKAAMVPPGRPKRLSVGIATTRAFAAEELGRLAQVEATADALREAMSDAGIVDPADVHFVQIKCPLLKIDRVQAAVGGTVTQGSYSSMAYSRAASALGVALGLGEIEGAPSESAILNDGSLYSRVASASAGIELDHSVVIVLGNSVSSASEFIMAHSVMEDAIDAAAVLEALSAVGLNRSFSSRKPEPRIVNIFAKAESAPDGLVRGFRHTMLDDTDISATRHARAAVGGLIAGLTGKAPFTFPEEQNTKDHRVEDQSP